MPPCLLSTAGWVKWDRWGLTWRHSGMISRRALSFAQSQEGLYNVVKLYKKVKVANTRLPSVGFWGWSQFLAVSLQVTWVINPAVGCHHFPPGPQLPSQPLRGLLPILLLGEQRHAGCEQFASNYYLTDSVVAAIWTRALLRLSPAR